MAREASCEDVNTLDGRPVDGADIAEVRNARESGRENECDVRVGVGAPSQLPCPNVAATPRSSPKYPLHSDPITGHVQASIASLGVGLVVWLASVQPSRLRVMLKPLLLLAVAKALCG